MAMKENIVAVGSQSHITLMDTRQVEPICHIDSVDVNQVSLSITFHFLPPICAFDKFAKGL